MKLKYFIASLLLLFFLYPSILCQDLSVLKFDRITVEDGLSNNIVYKILQDQQGVMWFGLHDGIDSYNGYDFKHFKPEADSKINPTYYFSVRSVFQVSGEEFWIGSGNNVYRYNYANDKFELIIKGLASNIEVNQIQDILITKDSICYIATNLGLFSYDSNQEVINDYTGESPSINVLHNFDGIVWIGTGANGIIFFDTQKKEFVVPYKNEKLMEVFSSLNAMSFFSDTIEKFTLIGTRNKGLYLFDHRRQEIRAIENLKIPYSHIRVIRRYGENYLIGMDGAGLTIIDKDFKPLQHYAHDEDQVNSLSSNGIYDILVDTENRIWVCTYGGGINLYDPNKKAFHVIRHEYNNPNSLRNNVIRSFLELDDMMVFGTAKGISILNHTGKWNHLPGLSASVEPKTVLSLCLDSRGQVWLGTFNGGIEIRTNTGRIVKTLRTSGGDGPELSTDYIYQIFEDHWGNVWIGGIRGGLMRYMPDNKRIEVFNEIQNVHSIIETSDSDIMIGTLEGVSILSKKDDDFYINSGKDTLLSNQKFRTFSILESRPGVFWIGTEGSGLFQYDRMKGVVEQYSTRDGLPSNIVYGILEDDNSNFWISTTSGLSRFNSTEGSFTNFSLADGISGTNFNYGAYYKASNGDLYFGSLDGVTYFNPKEISENSTKPEIIFTGISVLGMQPSDPDNPVYDLNINKTEKLELNHNQNSISIDFAAINYTGTEKNQYQWKLSGGEFGEGTWSTVSAERRAVFSYLPHGNYTFIVRASNNDGIWNNEGRSLDFIITPPFWQTRLAKIVYIILIALLFVAIQRYIFTYINQRQAKEKIQFFINIAHDIRTPLTLIAAPISKLVNSTKLTWEEKEEIRVAVKNSDRLKSLLNQLLEFQKASLRKQVLKVWECDIVQLVNEVLNNFQPLMDERMINASAEFESESILAWIDRQKIEKILYNLISNAIKYSHKGGSVHIKTEIRKRKVLISVRDNGRGIPAKQQKEIFKRYFRAQNAINTRETGSGVGLMLTQKLIELHKGTIKFTSTENVGSEFSIEFPFERSAYREEEILKGEAPDIELLKNEEIEDVSFSQQYTILIVEDNTELRHHIRNELNSSYNVLTARNGKLAYDTILKMDVDLIISDIMMPEMDGRELCQKVRNNIATSHIPIILLTALNSMEDKIEGLEYGADAYIEKPFDIEHLKVRIANLLKARERMKQRFLDSPDQADGTDISSKPDQELMFKLNEIAKERVLNENFSVKDLCRHAGMSRPVIYRKLKAYTGHSPQEYLIILRLNNASRLFRQGVLSIKDVAYESGFSDPKYFSKSFKKHYGVSPTSYIEGKR